VFAREAEEAVLAEVREDPLGDDLARRAKARALRSVWRKLLCQSVYERHGHFYAFPSQGMKSASMCIDSSA